MTTAQLSAVVRVTGGDARATSSAHASAVAELGLPDLCRQLAISAPCARRFIKFGGAELISAPNAPLRVRIARGSTKDSIRADLLANPPIPFTRETARAYTGKLKAIKRNQTTRLPRDTEAAIVQVLKDEGLGITVENLRQLIPEGRDYLEQIVGRATFKGFYGRMEVARTAGTGTDIVPRMVELGIATMHPASRKNQNGFVFPVEPTNENLTELLMKLPPARRSEKQVKAYRHLRNSLAWGRYDDHPLGIMEDAADLFNDQEVVPETGPMHRMLGGNRKQVEVFLQGYYVRKKIKRHLVRGAAPRRDMPAMAEILDRLHPEIRQFWADGDGRLQIFPSEDPTDRDLRYLGSINSDDLFQATWLVVVGGLTIDGISDKNRHAACAALKHLQDQLSDINSPGAVGADLTAWLELHAHTSDYRPRLGDVDGYKHAVAIIIRLLKSVPADVRKVLLPFRLSPPVGSAGLYRHVGAEIRRLADDAEGTKADRLAPLLEDPMRVLEISIQLRDRTRGLRDHILARLKEAQTLGETLPVKGAYPESFIDAASGVAIEQHHVYWINDWGDLQNGVVATGKLKPSEMPHVGGNKLTPAEAELFENRYAVSYHGCHAAEGAPTSPFPFIRQFEKRLFYAPTFHPDGIEGRLAAVNELDARISQADGVPSGLWYFAGKQRRRLVSLIQNTTGMTLLPITEVDHGQQYVTLALSVISEWPTRPFELLQNRLDDKKFRIFRVDGIDGPILEYKAHRKYAAHLGEGETNFYMFERSIDLYEELLGTTSRRFFANGPFPVFPGTKQLLKKKLEEGTFAFSTRSGVLSKEQLLRLANLMLMGIARIQIRDGKDIWCTAARRSQIELLLRQQASNHVSPGTTRKYGRKTDFELKRLFEFIARMRAKTLGQSIVVTRPDAAADDDLSAIEDEGELSRRLEAEIAVANVYEEQGLHREAELHRAAAKAALRELQARAGRPS